MTEAHVLATRALSIEMGETGIRAAREEARLAARARREGHQDASVGAARPRGQPPLARELYANRAPIAENPKTTFVPGHAGARLFKEALRLQRQYPNVWLETSSQSLSNVRRMVEEAEPDRIVHRSDSPFYHPAVSVSKVLLATEDRREIRNKILWKNARGCRRSSNARPGYEARSGRALVHSSELTGNRADH